MRTGNRNPHQATAPNINCLSGLREAALLGSAVDLGRFLGFDVPKNVPTPDGTVEASILP